MTGEKYNAYNYQEYIEQLESENARLREALGALSNSDNWFPVHGGWLYKGMPEPDGFTALIPPLHEPPEAK